MDGLMDDVWVGSSMMEGWTRVCEFESRSSHDRLVRSTRPHLVPCEKRPLVSACPRSSGKGEGGSGPKQGGGEVPDFVRPE